jgi:ABC-type transporter Mla subunit MlaD
MKLEDIDHWMTQITDVMVNTSSKLNQVADLNLALGGKLDRLTDKVDKLADLSAGTEHKIDRLSDKIDKLADVSASTNQKLDRLVEALLRREGQ